MGRVSTVVVAQTSDRVQAEIWVDALHEAGIEASLFERGLGAAFGGATTPFAVYPVLVAEGDIGRARSVIAELSGASQLSPVRDSAESRRVQRNALLTVIVIAIAIVVAGVAGRFLYG